MSQVVSKKQKTDSYKQGKKRVSFLQRDNVFAQMFRIVLFGTSKTK